MSTKRFTVDAVVKQEIIYHIDVDASTAEEAEKIVQRDDFVLCDPRIVHTEQFDVVEDTVEEVRDVFEAEDW